MSPVAALEPGAGDEVVHVRVSLSAAAPELVTLSWRTLTGSAAAGSDFDHASGTLIIAAGQVEGTIPITVHADAVPEDDETFTVEITAFSGVSGPRPAITVTIRDTSPVLPVFAGRTTDGGEGLIPVRLEMKSWQMPSPVNIPWFAREVKWSVPIPWEFAVAGADFIPASGAFVLPGPVSPQTAEFAVPNDSVSDRTKEFSVLWSLPPHTVAGSWGQRMVHELDTDSYARHRWQLGCILRQKQFQSGTAGRCHYLPAG